MSAVEMRLLRYFLAVVEEGSITRAAVALGVAQPAVSRAMRALEDAIEVPLLIRSSRFTTPTDAGRVLADEARIVTARLQTMVERARASGRHGQPVRCAAAIGDAALAADLTATFSGQHSADRPTDDPSAEVVVCDPGTLVTTLQAGGGDLILARALSARAPAWTAT